MIKLIKKLTKCISVIIVRVRTNGLVKTIIGLYDYTKYYNDLLRKTGIYKGLTSSLSHIGAYVHMVQMIPGITDEEIHFRIPSTITHGVYHILGINRHKITYDKYAMYLRMCKAGVSIPDVFYVTGDTENNLWEFSDISLSELKYLANRERVLAKPRFANSGIGIHIYEGGKLKKNYVYQRFVYNHEKIRLFQGNDYCSTIRYVVHNDLEMAPLASFIRFNSGRVTDHAKYGAICASVDILKGSLCSRGFQDNGNTYENHPVSGELFQDFIIPNWELCLDEVKKVCHEFKELPLIAFDIAVTDAGCKILEINAGCGTLSLQHQEGLLEHAFVKKYFTGQ